LVYQVLKLTRTIMIKSHVTNTEIDGSFSHNRQENLETDPHSHSHKLHCDILVHYWSHYDGVLA
jgi:hypothetical protein